MLTQYLCDTVVIVIAVVKAVEMVVQAPLIIGMVTALCCGTCAVFWVSLLFIDLCAAPATPRPPGKAPKKSLTINQGFIAKRTFYVPLRRWLRDNTTVELSVPTRSTDSRAPESCHSTDELRGE
ncbi:hypothetical protein V5799_008444 [Amblyomma americanum]|uniref:Uncharacterized protein n=1 Tax=Amblyomma americanum TaxID=6943 RepID=A0AAQ4FEV1_AMBAM